MTLTNLCLLLLCAVAGVVAWSLGGAEGTGVLLGALLASGVTGLGMAYQRDTLERRPNLGIGILGLFMVVKMFTLFAIAALLRFVPFAAERADWRAFALAFTGVAVLALLVGATDTYRRLRTPASASSPSVDG